MFVYIAQPYSSPSDDVKSLRYEAGAQFCAWFTLEFKQPHFAPIVQGHAYAYRIPADKLSHKDWLALDAPLLMASHKLLVLQLPGWRRSVGVAWELRMAKANGIRIENYSWDRLKGILSPELCRDLDEAERALLSSTFVSS